MEKFEIEFCSTWYQSGYHVYVITIEHIAKGFYYYVGQTGDRNYRAARSPFYRLIQHFNPYNKKATDAQLRNGLINFDLIESPSEQKNIRICMEEGISNKTVKIKSVFYRLSEYDGEKHIVSRKHAEAVEVALINHMLKNRLQLFNDPNKKGDKNIIPTKKQQEIAIEIYQEIISESNHQHIIS